ncbi:transmembrane protein 175 [Hymenobacter sp. DG25B]|jgi:uncharacterized membrane protein|uniref:TMEM175 family protein n=1 Tax=Hymenobacter sp. DG25B TaxID=1385664 RepID=UPI0005408CAD|nr:TMEM175 family protein [Hymenobacter sp. DG25B]AIZ63392.1 transmembrane protein 175 [Hymenobacter sp. DG25B]
MDYFAKHRVEAFSDGVFAIIVTLLVLEIKVPHLEQPQSGPELAQALLGLLPKVLSWMASFLMMCVIWVNHHRLLSQILVLDHVVFWLNANLLLWCSFIPFPTALLGDYLTNPMSAAVFGGVMAVMSLSFLLIRFYVQRHPGMLVPGVDQVLFRRISWRSLVLGPLLYSTGVGVAFVSLWLALAIFALIPFYFIFFNTNPAAFGQADAAPLAP